MLAIALPLWSKTDIDVEWILAWTQDTDGQGVEYEDDLSSIIASNGLDMFDREGGRCRKLDGWLCSLVLDVVQAWAVWSRRELW